MHDGTVIPRVHSVKHLESTGYPCVVQYNTQINEFDIAWADIVMINNPDEAHYLPMARYAKERGKKIWVDNDDDQLNVPLDHVGHLTYLQKDRREAIIECNKLADVMTLSNKNLLKTYGELNQNFDIFPCGYDERLMPEPDFTPRNKTILWRGSMQEKSLVEFSKAIGRLDKKFSGWEFVFINAYPWQVLEKIKKNKWYVHPGFMPVTQLWDYCRKLKPAIYMAPLTDNQFSRCRSNMGHVDATIAGALVIARDYTHHGNPGVITYKDVADFEFQMTDCMSRFENNGSFYDFVRESWEFIQGYQTFKVVNVKQWEIINAIWPNKK